MERFILYVRLGFIGFIILIIVWLAWVIIPIVKKRRKKKEEKEEKEEPKLRRFIFLAEGDSVKEVQELSPEENVDKAMEECRNKYGDELYYIEDIDRTEAAYKLLNRLKGEY